MYGIMAVRWIRVFVTRLASVQSQRVVHRGWIVTDETRNSSGAIQFEWFSWTNTARYHLSDFQSPRNILLIQLQAQGLDKKCKQGF